MSSSRGLDLGLRADEEFEDEGEPFLGGLMKNFGGALGLGEGEDEYFADQEFEDEGEPSLGGLMKNIGGSLGLGEGEDEYFADQEFFGDQEFEDEGEPFLGGLMKKWSGGALGLGEGEDEYFADQEYEDEDEAFVGLAAGLAAPFVIDAAKAALPAIGRLFSGGAGRRPRRTRRRRRPAREFEFEDEYFGDQEHEAEATLKSALGAGGSAPPAMAELLAAMAANSNSEAEAEALVGAATVMSLTPHELRALERSLPRIIQATTILSRVLRRQRATRGAVRVIPTVVKSTARPIARTAGRGYPPPTSVVGRVLTRQTRTVLTKPAVTRSAIQRNASAVRKVAVSPPPRR